MFLCVSVSHNKDQTKLQALTELVINNDFDSFFCLLLSNSVHQNQHLHNTKFSWLNVHGVHDVRQKETHTAEPLVPEPSAFEVDLAIEKLKSHKSPGIDQIPVELIMEGGRTIHYQIHKLTLSISNKEELPEEWKESIIVPIHKKGDKTDCNNYSGMSLLPTTYKILSNVLILKLTPYAQEIIGDHQCGFRHNRSTTDHIFCIRSKYLSKNWNTTKECISSL